MASSPKSVGRLFPVETNFQKMARRPGGLPRSKAVEAAAAKLEEMGPQYRTWLGEETAKLTDAIDALMEASVAFAARLEEAEHHCRQIRDVAGTMDFDLVTFVADNLWTILRASRHDMEPRRDPISCHVDALRLVSRNEYQGKQIKELPHFVQGLNKVAECATLCPHCIMEAQAANQNISSSDS